MLTPADGAPLEPDSASQSKESGFRALLFKAVRIACAGAPLSSLLVRVALGAMFAQAGWGKLQNLERTTGFFEGLGIPAPGLHALLVGNVEFVGGVLLGLGLVTRLSAVPLAIIMVVAIATALLPEVDGVLDFLTLDEVLYFAILSWVITHGPGKWSIDASLWKSLILPPTKEQKETS